MSLRLLLVCLAIQACDCGFHSVTECTGAACDGGAGGGAGGGGGASGGGIGGGAAGGSGGGTQCRDCVSLNEVRWGYNGGNAFLEFDSSLTTCRHYTHRSFDHQSPPNITRCDAEVALCPATTVQTIDAALADPAVKQAMAGHALFGSDPRPMDGAVFRITVGTDFVELGTCSSGTCGVPPALQTLADALQALDTAQLAVEPCHSVFP